MSTTPLEIMCAPFQVYVGPVGETFPDVDDTPTGNWVLLGTNGHESMAEAGVTVNHTQSVNLVRAYGTTAPVKALRASEDLTFLFTLLDVSPTEYARALNHNTVSTTAAGAATGGYNKLGIYQGPDVTQRAWLFRAINSSTELATGHVQYELPIGVVASSPSLVHVKGAPAALAFEVDGIFDTSQASGEELGRLIMQITEPTG